jgi:ABC-2 type transport system permease protein
MKEKRDGPCCKSIAQLRNVFQDGLGIFRAALGSIGSILHARPDGFLEVDQFRPKLDVAMEGPHFEQLHKAAAFLSDLATNKPVFLDALQHLGDFIGGSTLPLLPMAVMQSVVCFLAAVMLGLSMHINILVTIIVLLPAAVLFIAIGLLAGSLLTDRQVGGICGALLTNLAAWLSGNWFDLDLVGGHSKRLLTPCLLRTPSMPEKLPRQGTTPGFSRTSGG